MKMSQIVVVMLLLCMSTGCACLRGLGSSSSSSGSVRTIPTWVGQPVGEVVVDNTTHVARVHMVAPDLQSFNLQRSLCANDARMAIAEYMGWVRTNTATEGTVTRTTKQVTMGIIHGRRVDVEYWTEDFMNPAYHCVGIVKTRTAK